MTRGLAQAGAKVAVLGRRAEKGEAVAAQIRAVGGEALVTGWVGCFNRQFIEHRL